MADTDYNTLIFHEIGGDNLVVKSGGVVSVRSGGTIDIEAGAAFTTPGDIAVESGGSIVVESGADITVESGGAITVESGGALVANQSPGAATFVIGAEASNVINVGIQLQDGDGNDLTAVAAVKAYLSANADGSTLATAPTVGATIGTDGLLLPDVANQVFTLVSEADGDIDIDIEDAGTPTFYLVIITWTGQLIISDAITFA